MYQKIRVWIFITVLRMKGYKMDDINGNTDLEFPVNGISGRNYSRVDYDVCPERCDYLYLKPNCVKYHQYPATFHEAELRCYFEGGMLVGSFVADLQYLNDLVEKYKPRDKTIWHGLHATLSSGDFSYERHISQYKFPWVTPSQNDDTDKDCIAWVDNKLKAVDCDSQLSYVCWKYDADKPAENTKCGTLDKEYIYSDATKTCFKFHRDSRTWSRAFLVCASERARLAVINSEKEAEFIRELFKKHPVGSIRPHYSPYQSVAFIGFSDWFEHSGWSWRTIQGQSLEDAGYAKWAPGEPKNATGEFCGAVQRSGLLDDFACEYPAAFICEKKLTVTRWQHIDVRSGYPITDMNSINSNRLKAADWVFGPYVNVLPPGDPSF